MTRCASKLNTVISDLKIEKRSSKVINDEVRANGEMLEIALKTTQAEVLRGRPLRWRLVCPKL